MFFSLCLIPLFTIRANEKPGEKDSKSLEVRVTGDTTAIIPAMINVMQSGDRSLQAKRKLDSLLGISRKIGYIPGIARGIMMIGAFYWANPDSALPYLRMARQYSKQKDYLLGYYLSTRNISSIYLNYGVQDSALFWLIKTMAIWKPELGMQRHAMLQLDFGSWYSTREDFKQSLHFLFPAMISMKKSGDTNSLRIAYNLLGVMYTNLLNFDMAKYYFNQIFAITPESTMKGVFHTDTYNNLGADYMDIKKDYDSAIFVFRKSLAIALKFKLTEKLHVSYLNMGNAFLGLGQKDSARFYLLLARAMISKFTPRTHIAAIYINYGVSLLASGKTDSAKYYGDKGMALLREEGAGNMKITGYELLFQVDSIRGQYKSAVGYLRLARSMTNAIHNREILMKVAEKEFAYELDQKKSENNYLRKENILKADIIKNQKIILAFTIFIIVIIVVTLMIYIQNRKRLQSLIQTKDKFFSIISHDLRSPFSSLLGLLNELHTGYNEFSDDERKRILGVLASSAQNTYNLLENLLEWARTQQGAINSNPEMISVLQHVEMVLDLLKPRADKKGIIILTRIDMDIMTYADPVLFKNTILNLTNNAIKFTPGGGSITLSAQADTNSVIVCCSDTGIGIPAEYLKDVFRLNGKTPRKGTENEPGTGLGLILCKEFVDLMNGNISLESSENAGTKVCISLPLGQ